jgi:voltage-gated potassium channel
VREHGNSYNIFILVLTIQSLVIMGLLLLPLSEATLEALRFFDNLICFIFIGDFLFNLWGSHPRSEYFIRRRGWIDLLGSVPSIGILRLGGLLRLFRLFRLARIARLLGGQNKKQVIDDVIRNRGQYAGFITLLLVFLVLSTASVLVLEFESGSPDASITTGGDALWWSVVTITTVGYGDFYPVTTLGRITGVFVMFSGIGIIGALASILASLLVSPAPSTKESGEAPQAGPTVPATASQAGIEGELARAHDEIARMRAEMAALREQLAIPGRPGPGDGTSLPDG